MKSKNKKERWWRKKANYKMRWRNVFWTQFFCKVLPQVRSWSVNNVLETKKVLKFTTIYLCLRGTEKTRVQTKNAGALSSEIKVLLECLLLTLEQGKRKTNFSTRKSKKKESIPNINICKYLRFPLIHSITIIIITIRWKVVAHKNQV